jgi:hypothetical protein
MKLATLYLYLPIYVYSHWLGSLIVVATYKPAAFILLICPQGNAQLYSTATKEKLFNLRKAAEDTALWPIPGVILHMC